MEAGMQQGLQLGCLENQISDDCPGISRNSRLRLKLNARHDRSNWAYATANIAVFNRALQTDCYVIALTTNSKDRLSGRSNQAVVNQFYKNLIPGSKQSAKRKKRQFARGGIYGAESSIGLWCRIWCGGIGLAKYTNQANRAVRLLLHAFLRYLPTEPVLPRMELEWALFQRHLSS